jgi:hypothetical protein
MADYIFPNIPASFAQNDRIIFNYTGAVQEFNFDRLGNIKIECYGAKGGGNTGGKGGYAYGILDCAAYESVLTSKKLYILVGESPSTSQGGWNGGGYGSVYGAGGASDVRTSFSSDIYQLASLSSRIVVAAGGGAQDVRGNRQGPGSPGGGWKGTDGRRCTAGTQTSGGICNDGTGASANGVFGKGGPNSNSAGGGGGGWYGGAGGDGGAGGSSYVAGDLNCPIANLLGIKLTNSGSTTGVNSGNGTVIITVLSLGLKLYHRHLKIRLKDGTTKKIPLYEKTPALVEPYLQIDDGENIVYAKLDPQPNPYASKLKLRKKNSSNIYSALVSSEVNDDGTIIYHPGTAEFNSAGIYSWTIQAETVTVELSGGGGNSGESIYTLNNDGHLSYITGGSGASGANRSITLTNLPVGQTVNITVGDATEGSSFGSYVFVEGGKSGTDATSTAPGIGGQAVLPNGTPGNNGVMAISPEGNKTSGNLEITNGFSTECTTTDATITCALQNSIIENAIINNAVVDIGGNLISGDLASGDITAGNISEGSFAGDMINGSVIGMVTGGTTLNTPTASLYTSSVINNGIVAGGTVVSGNINQGSILHGSISPCSLIGGVVTGGETTSTNIGTEEEPILVYTITGCIINQAVISDPEYITISDSIAEHITITNSKVTINKGVAIGGTIVSGDLDEEGSQTAEEYGTIYGGTTIYSYGNGADLIISYDDIKQTGNCGIVKLTW